MAEMGHPRSSLISVEHFTYFSEIEEHFQRRRGSILICSPLDWALMEMWKEAGVTVEAALPGTPMVTFYRVSRWSWRFGRWLVEVPFYSMVNLVAERAVVPELIQNEMTGRRIAAEALRLLNDWAARDQMKQALGEVAARLWSEGDPMEKARQAMEKAGLL